MPCLYTLDFSKSCLEVTCGLEETFGTEEMSVWTVALSTIIPVFSEFRPTLSFSHSSGGLGISWCCVGRVATTVASIVLYCCDLSSLEFVMAASLGQFY